VHRHEFTWEGVPEGAAAELICRMDDGGVEQVELSLRWADAAAVPPPIRIVWRHPIHDIQHYWHPGAGRERGLKADWANGIRTRATYNSPVGCLIGNTGRNRMTLAFSDTLQPLTMQVGVHEETAELICSFTLFEGACVPLPGGEYRAQLRVDCREVPYYEALQGVEQWWSAMPEHRPAGVPTVALEPVYSTWYGFHQQLDAGELEAECERARALGCGAVIVDDGWQTSDNSRGYAYCGDWEPAAGKIPDMAAHVARVREGGMAYLLWYSVPFIGRNSRVWSSLGGKLLYKIDSLGAGVLDPRYPDVRDYLIRTYDRAVSEWNLDGLKLDFVDTFRLPDNAEAAGGGEPEPAAMRPGMDYASVPAAVDRLLSDVIDGLRARKPDFLIEFRQSYTGPLMRKYGNLLRAADCPADAVTNRVRTIDLRLLSGNTAVHSDMVMWHPEEPVESAALQLINVLFAVPQISVRLDRLPDDHSDMLAFWLRLWRQHRETLLAGKLAPLHPELLYPLVRAAVDGKVVYAAYQANIVIPLCAGDASYLLVNGTLDERLALRAESPLGRCRIRIVDCRGRLVAERAAELKEGSLHELEVPAAGVVFLETERGVGLEEG